MAKIDLSKYGITGTTEVVTTLLMNYYSRKRLSLLTKVMKLVRKANLELLML